ncbi:MAG: universal stress protein [Chloroflexota bacterium]
MYDTILVPLDGSDLAEAILPHVEQLASVYGSTVVLVSIIELLHMLNPRTEMAYDNLPTTSCQEMEDRAVEIQTYLNRQVEKLGEHGIRTRTRVEYGPVVATILHAAQHENAGLIAMASHGRGGLTDVYYGSVAAGILQRIDRPLLIVRAQREQENKDWDLTSIAEAPA